MHTYSSKEAGALFLSLALYELASTCFFLPKVCENVNH